VRLVCRPRPPSPARRARRASHARRTCSARCARRPRSTRHTSRTRISRISRGASRTGCPSIHGCSRRSLKTSGSRRTRICGYTWYSLESLCAYIAWLTLWTLCASTPRRPCRALSSRGACIGSRAIITSRTRHACDARRACIARRARICGCASGPGTSSTACYTLCTSNTSRA
jgi:hypothetical protein